MAKEIDFNNLESILDGIETILRIQTVGAPTIVPAPLILAGAASRGGLSATKIANNIISKQSDAGLPVGALPNGEVSVEEKMERIRIEEIVRALHEDVVIQVVIPPGQTLAAAGASPSGPVSVVGSTTFYTRGNAIIT